MCGAETLPVGDVLDRAAQLTLEQEGEVEIVHEAAAERLRDACEGIGAVLRFRLHA
jgi:peptide subunit release factor 1 (eRF1)